MEPLEVFFNLKVIKYPNGSVQVRYYDNPLSHTEDLSDYEDFAFGHEPEPLKSPFDGSIVKEVKFFTDDEKPLLSSEQKEINAYRSYSRCKQQIYSYSRSVPWEWFITITFNPDKVDRTSFDACSYRLRKWLNNQRRNAPDLQYLFVPELHKDGKAWHFHGLMACTGNIKFIDSGIMKGGQQIYNMSGWQYGFTTASRVKDIYRVSKYIGKYITKTLCDVTPGRHRYYISNNLPQPEITTYLFDKDWDIDNIIDSIAFDLNKKVAHVSYTQNKDVYTKVSYYELV